MPLTITVDAAKDAPKGAALGIGVLATARGPQIPAGVSLTAAALGARGFEAKPGQTLVIPGRTTQILVGLGSAASLTADTLRAVGAGLVRAAAGESAIATALLDAVPARVDKAHAAQALTEGMLLGSYAFDAYKSAPKPRVLTTAVLTGKGGRSVSAGVARGRVLADATAFTRDLVNEPPMTINPTSFTERAIERAKQHGFEIRVWDENDIERERLGGLRGVSLGSTEQPRLLRMEYRPVGSAPKAKLPTLALVGKGITFDSGGLSLKPSDSMITMKSDMAGAAAVLATMSTLRVLAVPCRVVGFCALSENMPGPSAYKLGDVLTARNGKTVEVHNTDAEGRLILMDALSLAAEEKPDAIVDIATLTGAQIVSLGMEISGLLSNNAALRSQLFDAADRSGESFWHLPLPERYRRHLDSTVADMKNIGNPGQAGTIIAGLFLQEFVNDVPWAHLDIAGPSFGSVDEGIFAKGATGVPTRTLIEAACAFAAPAR